MTTHAGRRRFLDELKHARTIERFALGRSAPSADTLEAIH
jgi:hypothetical protein